MKGWEPRTLTSYARRISCSMRSRRMRLARVWYPLPRFFGHAIAAASSSQMGPVLLHGRSLAPPVKARGFGMTPSEEVYVDAVAAARYTWAAGQPRAAVPTWVIVCANTLAPLLDGPFDCAHGKPRPPTFSRGGRAGRPFDTPAI